MISQSKQRGFTIVELLIVIVVIGILAAISIAAYTSITARANNANAQAAAKSVKDVAQNFNGLHGRFPTCKAEFTSGAGSTSCGGATTDGVVAKMPSDITFAAASAVTSTTDAKTVAVQPHGSPISGFTITYRDFSGTVKTMTVGETPGDAGTALANS